MIVDQTEGTPLPAPLLVPAQLPVFWRQLPASAPELLLARQALEDLRQTHPDSTPSNVKAVYMSPWKSHRYSDKLHPLMLQVREFARQVCQQHFAASLPDLNLDLVVTDCWGAIYESSDHTIPHHHFPADFAAVVYLEAGETCAPIIFESAVSVQPSPGLILLFPGLTKHHVPENFDHRVVIAMNINKIPSFVMRNTSEGEHQQDAPPG